MPWLAVRLFFDVEGEVVVDDGCRASRLQIGYDLRDHPARGLRGLDDRHRTMVLFYDHLDALLDLGQHGVKVAREFGFTDSDDPHVFDDTRCAGALSSGREFENEHQRL